MHYYGGKYKIRKDLWKILNREAEDRVFVDLFCGACNVVEGITTATHRIANDNNPYLIALLKAVQNGWIPPESVSKEMHQNAMNYQYDDALNGFILIGCSYGGGFRSGYAHSSDGRNYAKNAKNTLIKQKPKLSDVEFVCSDYRSIEIPEGAVVYCDPPYKDTYLKYYDYKFDYDSFMDWVESNKNRYTIFISEYKANENPNWDTVYERESYTCVCKNQNSRKGTVEILQKAV